MHVAPELLHYRHNYRYPCLENRRDVSLAERVRREKRIVNLKIDIIYADAL